ncbi:6-phosphogluconolactonase, cycloisomerase 2 family [Chitinophaga jiangningensis]|uniref:6-phosphogluconolactonase, cycloisomerase 2 family n=1 Tax=Chitinophaga jiangningensis TaxID=1419482 RepID=A0A1M6ZW49_9BACT|nr:lactonase family protein [Chitinophaga jiangningensis]SHL34619.1 6-phosphogluconolactonase, cycloisomerase 2 family [Chitinophaga jiangningensis]
MNKFHRLSCLAAACLLTISAHAQRHYMFVGSYNNSTGQEGIYVYRFHPSNGTAGKVSAVTDVVNPSYLNLSFNGKYLYAATESRVPNGGKVSSYSFDSIQGKLQFINSQTSGGENPVYVAVNHANTWLANANYTAGSLRIHPLNSDGSIGASGQTIVIKDSSTGPRQKQSHVHSIGFSPDEQYVYAPDLGADKIHWFRLQGGATTLVPATPPFTLTARNAGPRHFEFHRNGKFGYCVEEISGNVVVYRYANGGLTPLQTIAAHALQGVEDYGAGDIHLSPDGKYLYATTRGNENIIVTYNVNVHTGLLTKTAITASGGNHPRNFVIDPTGNYLLVAHQMSDDIVLFRRNKKTGALTPAGKIDHIKAPSCIKIRAYNVKE